MRATPTSEKVAGSGMVSAVGSKAPQVVDEDGTGRVRLAVTHREVVVPISDDTGRGTRLALNPTGRRAIAVVVENVPDGELHGLAEGGRADSGQVVDEEIADSIFAPLRSNGIRRRWG